MESEEECINTTCGTEIASSAGEVAAGPAWCLWERRTETAAGSEPGPAPRDERLRGGVAGTAMQLGPPQGPPQGPPGWTLQVTCCVPRSNQTLLWIGVGSSSNHRFNLLRPHLPPAPPDTLGRGALAGPAMSDLQCSWCQQIPTSARTADTELDSVGGTGDTAPSFPEWLHSLQPVVSIISQFRV